jgi:replication factor A1
MKVNDLQDKTAVDDIELQILEISEAKQTSYGPMQNAKAQDDTGTVDISFWGDQTGKYKTGDRIRISKGWCKEYRGQLQVSAGKFGKIEKTGEAPPATPATNPKTTPQGPSAKAGTPTGATDQITGRPILERTVHGNYLRPTVSEIRGEWKTETYVQPDYEYRDGTPVYKI